MKYEIYIDSLIILNLGMNLYLLELTNCILHHTATWKRVIFGAASGSLLSVIPLLLPLDIMIAGFVSFILAIVGMVLITFRVSDISAYIHLIEVLMVMTIVLGSVIQYVLRRFPQSAGLSLEGILLIGGICFLVIRHQLWRKREVKCECKVTLGNDKTRIKVNALVDTGNSLIEPISGLPVAVLDKKVFENLFYKNKPGGFRVIPYHSIDKKNGIMPGYLIPEMRVEWDGFCRDYYNVYVGVRPQDMEVSEKYKMIINPEMLKERKVG